MVNRAEKFTDTIAAIITPPGLGAVSVIRISGPASITTLDTIFSTTKKQKPINFKDRYFYYGNIFDSSGAVLDDSMAVVMKGPNSYTGEDVAEIFCHGSPLITKKILALIFSLSVRVAESGEFTKRAFLNGKMDLSEAESVADIITAETELALASAKSQRRGGLSSKVDSIKEDLIKVAMLIEAELDFSEEEEVERSSASEINQAIEKPEEEIKKLLSSYNEGRIIKDGIKVLILGRPNSGKSSLLNLLLKEERAIVTDVAGTTRDTIEEVVNIGGLAVRLIDTAGLRDTDDRVEAIGVKVAKDRITEAGLVLYLIDLSQGREDFFRDLDNLKEVDESEGDRKIIVVMNKADIMQNKGIEPKDVLAKFGDGFEGYNLKFVSVVEETGIEDLEKKIVEESLGEVNINSASNGEVLTNLRHRDCLARAHKCLVGAKESVARSDGREFTASELRGALDALGEITGEVTTDDILERIFSTFCIGK